MRKSALLLTVVLFAARCWSDGRPAIAADSPEAMALYRKGLELRRRGDYDAALVELREAIERAPDFVEAHREYQNLMLIFGFQEDLMERYGDALYRNPRSARAHYLYGRILDDQEMQDAEFRRAVALDGGFFWGHYGRGVVALRRGEKRKAMREIDEALSLRPSSPQGRRITGVIEALSGRHEKALEMFQRLVEEDPHYKEAYLAALHECRLLGDLNRGHELSGRAAKLFPKDAFLLASRGYFLARRGDPAGAVACYERARAIEPIPCVFVSDLRRLYAERGLHENAVGLWEEIFAGQLLREGNMMTPLWRRLKEAVEDAGSGGGAASRVALLRAYMGMGWWAEAAAMRRALDESGAMNADAAAVVEEAEAGERLLRQMDEFGFRLETARARGERKVSFRAAVDALAETVQRAYGRTLILPGAVRSAAGVRWLGDLPGRPQPLLNILRAGNRDLIFFENVFAREMEYNLVELIYCSLEGGAQDPFHYWKTVCCLSGNTVGSSESGLAYPPFTVSAVFYDQTKWRELCELRREQKRNPLLGSWFIENVSGEKIGAREIIYSRMLERRLFEKACRAIQGSNARELIGRLEDRFTDSVAEHEYQHLVDLRRHLPVGRHPAACFVLACRNFFAPSRIETWFEERAILRSLAGGREPYCALFSIHALLDGPRGPHRIAARRLMRHIVEEVAANAHRYPAIDTERNIMNQLYLLSGEEIEGIARVLYEKSV